MNKKIVVFILVLIAIIGAVCIAGNANKSNNVNQITEKQTDEKIEVESVIDTVIIQDKKIKNENLIDEFITKTEQAKENNSLKSGEYIELKIKEDGSNLSLRLYAGKNEISENNRLNYSKDKQEENVWRYVLTKNNERVNMWLAYGFGLTKKKRGYDIALYLASTEFEALGGYSESREVFRYRDENSEYNPKIVFMYIGRNDNNINEIYDTGEYKIKTFGGDVQIGINDIELSLEYALNQKVITENDILEQLKYDEEYGECYKDMYNDGGSVEYTYSNFAIVKLHSIAYTPEEPNKYDNDLVIGTKGNLLSEYNKIQK